MVTRVREYRSPADRARKRRKVAVPDPVPLVESKYMPRCDFCGARPVEWSYPARDFSMLEGTEAEIRYLSAWAACEICHGLIQAGDKKGLDRRACDSHREIFAEVGATARIAVYSAVAAQNRKFFENRTGGPRRLGTVQ